MSLARAERIVRNWRTCGCNFCGDPDLWYEAMAVLLAERAPA